MRWRKRNKGRIGGSRMRKKRRKGRIRGGGKE
jgi:hypothetical protein